MCLQARISPDPSRSTLPSRGWSASSRKTWRGALPGLVCISLRARLASAAQVDDLQEDQGLPDPEKDPKQEEGMEGMGDLGRNLEFMMMKIAQLDYFAGRGVVVSCCFQKCGPQSMADMRIRSLPGDGRGTPAAADQRHERVEESTHEPGTQRSSAASFHPGGQ